MNRTVLITGTSGNLGHAVLERYRKENFSIAALESLRSAGKIQASEHVKTFPVDLMDEQGVEKVIAEVFDIFDNIELAVLTVGGFAMGGISEVGVKEIDSMYRLNFITAYNVARQLFVRMAKKKSGGHLIFIGSRPAMKPEQAKSMVAYSLSKSLVFRLAEVINEDGRDKGIIASVVVPGIMDTPGNRESMPAEDFSKWVSPQNIADNIFHLSTPSGKKLRESIIKVYGDS